MAEKIAAVNFASAVKKILGEYGQDVSDAVNDSVETVAKQATQELKGAGTFRGSKYRKSWSFEVKKKTTYTDATVYNKRHYRLTHLLEFGHAKQNGGRTRAFPHIAPVNDKVEEMFEKELKARI